MEKGLWHEVSEEEKEEILKEAKNLLNDFASKLDKVKTTESHFQKGNGIREEGEPWETEEGFKEIFLLNAPFVEDDSIVAERGSWKK